MEVLVLLGLLIGAALVLWAAFWVVMLAIAIIGAIVTSRSFLVVLGLLLVLFLCFK
jgi:hypothetical protein